jgi:hypothetical protein
MLNRKKTIVADDIVDTVLEKIKNLDSVNEDIGIRAFVWEIEKAV